MGIDHDVYIVAEIFSRSLHSLGGYQGIAIGGTNPHFYCSEPSVLYITR